MAGSYSEIGIEPLFRVPDYAGLPWRVVVLGWWLLLRIYVGFANHSA